MADERTGLNEAIAIWAVVAGAVLAGAITALFAIVPVWGWVALSAFVLLSGVALLSFSDPASRNFLAGTLRHRTYTQIYTTLTRRLVMRIWAALCDEPGDPKKMEREEISVAQLFHHALTWRLYDKALLIALAYPVLLPVAQWIVTGEETMIGTTAFLSNASFLQERVTILVSGVLIFAAFGVRLRLAARVAAGIRSQALTALPYVVWGALVFGVLTIFPNDEGQSVIAMGALAAALGTSKPEYYLVSILALWVGLAAGFLSLFDSQAAYALLLLSGAPALLTLSFSKALRRHDIRSTELIVRLVTAVSVALFAIVATWLVDFQMMFSGIVPLFAFLVVLPLLNALFDTVSYAATLTLIRRGLRSAVPWLWGLIDLAVASVLFLALGVTLVVVLHGLNTLAGVPLVDLSGLLDGIQTDPGAYIWLYAMLFSTILPTALHGILSLLGVQGLWPRVWRRPVAAWVEGATATPLAYLRAGLALGVIWTIPLMLLGAIAWGLWAIGGGAITWALGQYFDTLLWLAAIPVGAI